MKKTYVMVLKDKSRIFLTVNQAEQVKKAIYQHDFIEIENRLISKYAILYIIPSYEYDVFERERKGEWRCKYNSWHTRGEECGCAELERWFKTYDQIRTKNK